MIRAPEIKLPELFRLKMNSLTEELRKFIKSEKLITGGEIILAGVSGGADSVCLFHTLCELREDFGFSLYVVHINHMIREAAEGEAVFVEELCKKWDVPFYRRDINIPEITKEAAYSEEEAGRNERYRAFCDIAGEISRKTGKPVKIATAHNRNDQAETVLHNLFRGSRIKGLSGIRARGTREGFELIRPLIMTGRDEIEKYLSEKGYEHCTDNSNFTDEYTRNRIRHNIIPVAREQINPRADIHVAETAEYLAKIDDFLEEQALAVKNWLIESSKEEVVLDCIVLATVPEIIRERLIIKGIHLLYPHVKDIQSVHIQELSGMVLSTDGSAMLSLPYGIKAVRNYGKLYFYFESDEKLSHNESIELDLSKMESGDILEKEIPNLGLVNLRVFPYKSSFKIPTTEYTKWFNYDKINNSLQFRTRRTGDIISVGNGNKKLKKFMIDEKIPINKRDELYILADGGNVLWIPGYRIGDFYKLGDDSDRVLEVTVIK